MTAATPYIQVIVPLKLDWEPFYRLDEWESVAVGDRVAVPFAGRRYIAVVSAVNVRLPDNVSPSSVRSIYSIHPEYGRILVSELTFWRKMAAYYMCSVGEVYKAARPTGRTETQSRRRTGASAPVPMALPENSSSSQGGTFSHSPVAASLVASLRKAFSAGRTALLASSCSEQALIALCLREHPFRILWLVPEIKALKSLADRLRPVFGDDLLVWDSSLSPARKEVIADKLRYGESYVVLGTRSALFLPFTGLDLVIVSDEHDPSYKQTSPSPRYNGRDAALLLAGIFDADVVLESKVPSFESRYNVMTGKYAWVSDTSDNTALPFKVEIVDVSAERRKRGMVGELSRKLIDAVSRDNLGSVPCRAAFFIPKQASFPKMTDVAAQLAGLYGQDVFVTDDLPVRPIPSDTTLLVVFGVDSMLGRDDFRADERVLQIVCKAIAQCGASLRTVVIQTREPLHPVFRAISGEGIGAMLDERREFAFPPYTRLVDIRLKEQTSSRNDLTAALDAMEEGLSALGLCRSVLRLPDGIRLAFARTRSLSASKNAVRDYVEAFARKGKLTSSLVIDVDP